jgi:sugar phosphate permease
MGGVQSFILEDTGWQRSQLALAVTVGTWASAVLTPLIGRLADRHGARWLMPIGSAVAGVSLIWIGGSVLIWHFWIAYILGRAVSNPVLIGVVPRTVAVNFFRRHRNLALSLISEARPVGGAIVIQLIALIAIFYDWRTAYQLLGVVSLVMVVPLILIMRRRPEDLGLLPDGARPVAGVAEPIAKHGGGRRRWSSSAGGGREFDWRSSEALRTRTFWFITATAAVGTLTSSAVGFSLVPYLTEEVSLSRAQAAGVLSFGTILTIANLGWAFLANRFTPRWCLVAVLVVSSAMVLYLYGLRYVAPAYAVPLAFLYALLWGLGHGPVGTLEHMMLAQFFGRNSYGTITGMLGPLQTTALGLGPLLSAVARDVTGDYGVFLLLMFAIHLSGIVLIFFIRPPSLPARAAQTAGQS